MNENNMKNSPENAPASGGRRKAIKKIAVGVGVLAGYSVLPDKWIKPVVGRIVLPAHAQTSIPPTTTIRPTTTADPSHDPSTTPHPSVTCNPSLVKVSYTNTGSNLVYFFYESYVHGTCQTVIRFPTLSPSGSIDMYMVAGTSYTVDSSPHGFTRPDLAGSGFCELAHAFTATAGSYTVYDCPTPAPTTPQPTPTPCPDCPTFVFYNDTSDAVIILPTDCNGTESSHTTIPPGTNTTLSSKVNTILWVFDYAPATQSKHYTIQPCQSDIHFTGY